MNTCWNKLFFAVVMLFFMMTASLAFADLAPISPMNYCAQGCKYCTTDDEGRERCTKNCPMDCWSCTNDCYDCNTHQLKDDPCCDYCKKDNCENEYDDICASLSPFPSSACRACFDYYYDCETGAWKQKDKYILYSSNKYISDCLKDASPEKCYYSVACVELPKLQKEYNCQRENFEREYKYVYCLNSAREQEQIKRQEKARQEAIKRQEEADRKISQQPVSVPQPDPNNIKRTSSCSANDKTNNDLSIIGFLLAALLAITSFLIIVSLHRTSQKPRG